MEVMKWLKPSDIQVFLQVIEALLNERSGDVLVSVGPLLPSRLGGRPLVSISGGSGRGGGWRGFSFAPKAHLRRKKGLGRCDLTPRFVWLRGQDSNLRHGG